MAQRLGPRLLDRAKHVHLVIGPDGYRALPSLIESARRGERVAKVDFDLEEHYEDFRARRFDGVNAWIPVQRGCDYRCTYCIVPTTRGPERSRALADVVREARETVARGDHRDHAARTDGELVQRRHARFRGSAARGGRRAGRAAAALHEPASERFHRSRHRGDGRRPARCASTCTCPCSRARRARSSACCAATRARSIASAWRACARRFPGSRSRRTSSSASRARRKRNSRRR